MKLQSFIREELDLLNVQEIADALGYTVDKRGYCKQLERITDKKYCQERNMKPLPHYFGGSNMMVERGDLMLWVKQFKH